VIAFLRWLLAGRCPAVALGYGERYRCDERRGHAGQHRTDRGMYDVAWIDDTYTTEK
jgi:hypothetical protein